MKPDPRYTGLPKSFWALVRLVGQQCGYTQGGSASVPGRQQIEDALRLLDLRPGVLGSTGASGETTWELLAGYLTHRSQMLHTQIEPNLMDANQAKQEFARLKKSLKPRCPLPMNKQKGTKKAPAYFTGIINMLVDANSGGHLCDYDPRALVTVSRDGVPVRTFARRMDGAFPSVLNPVAVWEVKEYYYTTTFGSRVADGVYETLLDGMECEELAHAERIAVRHYLMIDARYTWWECGKSYLCRIVDMLHMGYVDEVLVGREVLSRLPGLAREWSARVGQSSGVT
jgi:hypothetical protein